MTDQDVENALEQDRRDRKPLVESTGVTNPLVLVQSLIERGADPATLDKWLDVAERWERNQALKAFAEAMAKTQRSTPIIVSDSINTQINKKYPSLRGILRALKPILGENGLSVYFGEETSPKENHCRTTCEVQHVAGHSKIWHLDLPLDGVGLKGNANMTAIHGRLSSDTYAQVRLLRKAFNLTVADDATDNDGNAVSGFITPDQIGEINDLLMATGASLDKFLAWVGGDTGPLEGLDKIPQNSFPKVIAQMKGWKKKNGGKS